jgi:ATP synthase protein I
MYPEDRRIVVGALLAVGVAAVPVLLVAGLRARWPGLLGAVFGLALAAAFFAVTIVVVSVASRISVDLMLPAALGTYTAKMIVILLVLFLLRGTTTFNRTAFALSVVVGACVFLAAELRVATRARTPYVTLPDEKE